MQKMIKTSVLLLGIVFLAGCGQIKTSQLQPEPIEQKPSQAAPTNSVNETDSWKSYANFGVGVKYPNDGTYSIENPGNNYFIITQEHPGNRFHIKKETNPKELKGKLSDKVIAGKTFQEFHQEGMGDGYGYIIKQNGGYYVFESIIGPTNAVFEKIMTTVEFSQDATQQSGATANANLQIYKNEKYEFEIKYPPSYIIQDVKDGVVTLKSPTRDGLYDLDIQVNQDPALSKLTLDAIIQSKSKSGSIREHQKTTLAGQVAYEGVSTGMVNEYILLVKSGSNLYELLFNTGNKDSLTENKAMLDANQKLMLSTFKFTK